MSSDPNAPPTSAIPSMISFPNLPNGVQMSLAATELLDAADKRVPTLTLNARRKSFHGVAVLMFLPGIAFDVSVELLSDFIWLNQRLTLFGQIRNVKHEAGVHPFGI